MTIRILGLCLAAMWFTVLAACDGIEKYGKADYYDQHAPAKIKVIMPPNAPFISEEFFRGEDPGDKQHHGIDIWAKRGTPILAAASGRIERSFYEPAFGQQIVIDHGLDENGARVRTQYKHLYERQVKPGQLVVRGQQIGTMGATGALGMMVHLHFEVQLEEPRKANLAYDPQLFWIMGPGRVTCFEPGKTYPDRPFRTTYPVPCR